MIRKFIVTISTLFLLTPFAPWAYGETAVIVNPSNSSAITESDINKIFLGKTSSFPGGGSAKPVNQTENSSARSRFDEVVLGKSSSQVKSYWSKLLFTGKGTPPEEVDGDAAVKNIVSGNANAIGYVDAGSVDSSVKVVHTF